MSQFFCHLDSPIGLLSLLSPGQGLSGIRLIADREADPAVHDGAIEAPDRFEAACEQLQAYFAGRRRVFDLALAPQGTSFQQRVWTALRDVEYATTASYGEVARRIGTPGAARAVGLANARNPIPIVVPCHRIIGADGRLTGYAGGLERKRWLLSHEKQSMHSAA